MPLGVSLFCLRETSKVGPLCVVSSFVSTWAGTTQSCDIGHQAQCPGSTPRTSRDHNSGVGESDTDGVYVWNLYSPTAVVSVCSVLRWSTTVRCRWSNSTCFADGRDSPECGCTSRTWGAPPSCFCGNPRQKFSLSPPSLVSESPTRSFPEDPRTSG